MVLPTDCFIMFPKYVILSDEMCHFIVRTKIVSVRNKEILFSCTSSEIRCVKCIFMFISYISRTESSNLNRDFLILIFPYFVTLVKNFIVAKFPSR